MSLSLRGKANILAGVGVLLIALALSFGLALFPSIVRNSIIEEVQLVPGKDAYNSYVDVQYPITIKFFFFNVTNPYEVIHDGATPKLTEIGPYTYRERRTKNVFSTDVEDDTITYEQKIQYFFDERLSEGNSEDDQITTVNALMIGVAHILEHQAILQKTSNIMPRINNIFEDVFEAAITTHTVKELTFGGYNVIPEDVNCSAIVEDLDIPPIILNQIEKNCTQIIEELPNILNSLHLTAPELPPTIDRGKFAFFNGRNDTGDGNYTVYRGVKDYRKFGQIKTWNGKSSVDFWEGDTCNMINGTDASVSAPFVSKDQRFWIFTTDLCRSLYAEFEKEVEFKGLPGYRFVATEKLMANPYENEDNWCFCPESGCIRSAILNASKCQGGAPVQISSPHFYLGDGFYETQVIGLEPHKDIHETYMDVEPKSGALLRIMQRIQINMFTKRYQNVNMLQNVPEILFPIFWVEQYVEMDDPSADHYRTLLVTGVLLLEIISWIMLAAGLTLTLVAAFLYYKFYSKHDDSIELETNFKDKKVNCE